MELEKYVNRHGGKGRRLAWEIAWAVFARATPRWCLNGWRKMWLRLFGATVGKGVRIQGSAEIWQPDRLKIGDHSWIDGDVKLYSVDQISIGHDAVVSEGAFLCTASHDIGSPTFELKTAPIAVGDCAWIGARAIVLPGVTVGEGAVAGAGAVVTKDVAPWTVVGGNPAREIGKRRLKD